jgi:hypothetical protein
MHGPINVKSSNNTSKWQMEFNSAFKRLSNNASTQQRENNKEIYAPERRCLALAINMKSTQV